jgi:hypothetical protein
MAEAYRLYAGTQAGMILFRGVGDIWTSMGGSREFEPYFKDKVVDSVYGCRQHPEIVFAGVTFDGLYRTKDCGRRWQRVSEGDIRWVTVDPTVERGDSWEEIKSLTEMSEEVKYKWYFPHPPHQGQRFNEISCQHTQFSRPRTLPGLLCFSTLLQLLPFSIEPLIFSSKVRYAPFMVIALSASSRVRR